MELPKTNIGELQKDELVIPVEGKIIEKDGQLFEWCRVKSGVQVFNPETGQQEDHYHTLRTWFAHTSMASPRGGCVNGPGWDRVRSLSFMTDNEMLEKYGHVFTREEIDHPAGVEDWETGEITGAMPDIPYLELVPLSEDDGINTEE
jgi:hypothetical protein